MIPQIFIGIYHQCKILGETQFVDFRNMTETVNAVFFIGKFVKTNYITSGTGMVSTGTPALTLTTTSPSPSQQDSAATPTAEQEIFSAANGTLFGRFIAHMFQNKAKPVWVATYSMPFTQPAVSFAPPGIYMKLHVSTAPHSMFSTQPPVSGVPQELPFTQARESITRHSMSCTQQTLSVAQNSMLYMQPAVLVVSHDLSNNQLQVSVPQRATPLRQLLASFAVNGSGSLPRYETDQELIKRMNDFKF